MAKRERKSEYKPLLLTTTVRNPERYKALINVLVSYNGKVLTKELIDQIMFDMISKKLYCPMHITRTPRLKSQLIDMDRPFSASDTKEIILNSPQDHKEAGFDYGWPSRFDTFYKLAKVLGFVYYEMGKPIELSEAGMKLAKSIEPEYTHLENQVFLNAFVKYQRVNPFKRVLNRNKPLILLLQTIGELRKIYGENSAGISRTEMPILLCWRDDNYIELANKIKSIREKFGFTPSDDYIYGICKVLLDATGAGAEKRFKKSNITRELPDDFLRKMRLTGLISIRGGGRFIDYNTLESAKIADVLSRYATPLREFASEKECFDYMKEVDSSLISIEAAVIVSETERERLFEKWVSAFELDEIKSELKIVSSPRGSTHNEVLKYISEPVRLEFLTALALKKVYPELKVIANYVIDDEGLPTSFAPGGGADIVCLDSKGNILFEVTLLTGSQQNIREMPSIQRHLEEVKIKTPDSFSVMICPRIHPDTFSYSQWLKSTKNLIVVLIEVASFANLLGQKVAIRDFANL